MSTRHPGSPTTHQRGEVILDHLRSLADESNVAGMARYGIRPAHALGISMKEIRSIAASIEPDHELALWLWQTGVHEARLLATIVDEPSSVTIIQMDRWARQCDSWDLCDQCCANLFEKTPFAWKKSVEWATSGREFVKRAGFSLMARLAVSNKEAEDNRYLRLLPHIRKGADDERNLVKKAVSWALRQIGKRKRVLYRHSMEVARELTRSKSPSARWIGSDAVREFKSPAVIDRLRKKAIRQRRFR